MTSDEDRIRFIDVIKAQQDLPPRLQTMLDALLALTPAGNIPSADVSALNREIGRREGTELADGAFRQRVARLNSALALAPFRVMTRGGTLTTVPTGEWESVRRTADLGQALRERSSEALRLDVGSIVPPRARPGKLSVMFSYAWLTPEQQRFQLDFFRRLKVELNHRPERFQNLPKIDIWRDEDDLAVTETGTPQMDAACSEAFLGLVMLSRKYPSSTPCMRELDYFLTEEGNNRPGKSCLVVNVNCNLHDIPSRFKKDTRVIVSGQDGSTLLQIWSSSDAAARDQFVVKVAQQIFQAAAKFVQDFNPSREVNLDTEVADGAIPKLSDDLHTGRLFNLDHDGASSVSPRARRSPLGLPVTPAVEAEEPGGIPIVDHLVSWAKSGQPNEPRLVALLGDFGMGKTVTCQLVTRRLLDEARQNPNTPVPIYLDLRKIRRPGEGDEITLEGMVEEMLRVTGQPSPAARDVVAFAREHGALIVFDGLDEITNKLPLEVGRRVYRELLSIVPTEVWNDDADRRREKNPERRRGPSILISCRSQYFADISSERGFFCDSDRSGLDPRSDIAAFVMLPFDGEQVRQYIRKNLSGADGERALTLIEETYDLQALAARPILLRYIGEMVERLEQEKMAGRPINIARLYDILVEQAFQRDEPKHVIPIDDKKLLLQALAVHLSRRGQEEISTTALTRWLDEEISARHPRLEKVLASADGLKLVEVIAQDFRNATLLSRPGEDGFRFGHTSIREYFLAGALYRSVGTVREQEIWSIATPSKETIEFFIRRFEIEPLGDRGEFGQRFSLLLSYGKDKMVRNLAFLIWRSALATGVQLPRPAILDCTGLILDREVFAGTSAKRLPFKNSRWTGASIRQAQFSHVDLSGAIFDEADASSAVINACQLKGASWKKSLLGGTWWRGCTLDLGALEGATLTGSYAHQCYLGGRPWHPQQRVPHGASGWRIVPHQPVGIYASLAWGTVDGEPAILGGNEDGRLRIWSAKDGRLISLIESDWGVTRNALLKQIGGKDVVIASNSRGQIEITDVETGKISRHFNSPSPFVTAITVADAHEKTVLAALTTRGVMCWDAISGCELPCQSNSEYLSRGSIAFGAHDGDIFAAVVRDNEIQISSIFDGVVHFRCPADHFGRNILSLHSSGDDLLLMTNVDSRSVLLHRVNDWSVIGEYPAETHISEGHLFDLEGDLRIVLKWRSGEITVWDEAGNTPAGLNPSSKWVSQAAMAVVDGRRLLATTSSDNTIQIVDEETGGEWLSFGKAERHTEQVGLIKLDGEVSLLSGGASNLLHLQINGEQHHRTFGDILLATRKFALLEGDNTLLAAHDGHNVNIWDLDTGTRIRSLEASVDWSTQFYLTNLQNNPVLAIYNRDSVQLIDVMSGKFIIEFEIDGKIDYGFSAIGFDNNVYIAYGHGNKAFVHDLFSEHATTILCPANVISVKCAISNGIPMLAAGCADGNIYIFTLGDGKLLQRIEAHGDYVRSIEFCSVNQRNLLISGGDDAVVRLWDLDSGRMLQTAGRHAHWVESLAVYPSERGLVVASGARDGTIQVANFDDLEKSAKDFLVHRRGADRDIFLERDGKEELRLSKIGANAWRDWIALYISDVGFSTTIVEDFPRIQ